MEDPIATNRMNLLMQEIIKWEIDGIGRRIQVWEQHAFIQPFKLRTEIVSGHQWIAWRTIYTGLTSLHLKVCLIYETWLLRRLTPSFGALYFIEFELVVLDRILLQSARLCVAAAAAAELWTIYCSVLRILTSVKTWSFQTSSRTKRRLVAHGGDSLLLVQVLVSVRRPSILIDSCYFNHSSSLHAFSRNTVVLLLPHYQQLLNFDACVKVVGFPAEQNKTRIWFHLKKLLFEMMRRRFKNQTPNFSYKSTA